MFLSQDKQSQTQFQSISNQNQPEPYHIISPTGLHYPPPTLIKPNTYPATSQIHSNVSLSQDNPNQNQFLILKKKFLTHTKTTIL